MIHIELSGWPWVPESKPLAWAKPPGTVALLGMCKGLQLPLPVAVLSNKPGKKGWNVIKEEAYWANTTGGIYTAMEDLQEKYQPFWLAVSESGFLPEVRIMGNRSGSRAYLYARLPEEL